jgi:hypothetical protein
LVVKWVVLDRRPTSLAGIHPLPDRQGPGAAEEGALRGDRRGDVERTVE